MRIENFRNVIGERKRISIETQDEWDYGIEQCREKEIEILTENIDETIYFLENECTEDEFVWISEVFDEIVEKTQSKEFISILYKVAKKYPEETKKYHLIDAIKFAESCLE